jgi:hypothetical protein
MDEPGSGQVMAKPKSESEWWDTTYKKRTVKTIPPRPGAGSFVRQFGGLSSFTAGSFPFQPQLTSTGVGGPDIARRIVVTDLSYRWSIALGASPTHLCGTPLMGFMKISGRSKKRARGSFN